MSCIANRTRDGVSSIRSLPLAEGGAVRLIGGSFNRSRVVNYPVEFLEAPVLGRAVRYVRRRAPDNVNVSSNVAPGEANMLVSPECEVANNLEAPVLPIETESEAVGGCSTPVLDAEVSGRGEAGSSSRIYCL